MIKLSSQDIIIEYLHRYISHGACAKILELGMGKGNYTKTLRKAFPEAFILAFDKGPCRINHSTMEIVDEIIVRDITKKHYSEYKEAFDIVTFGSPKIDPGFHFGFVSREIFANVLNSLAYYLKPGGIFFFVMKSRYTENIAQENHFLRDIDFLGKKEKEGFIEYDDVCNLARQILKEKGEYNFSEFLIKDPDIIQPGKIKPRADLLRMQHEMGIVTDEQLNKYLPQAMKVDESISKNGEEYGFFKIQIAQQC